MGLLSPDVLCTLLVTFFILRVGAFLHLWRLWTSGLTVLVGAVSSSFNKPPSGRGGRKKKEEAPQAPQLALCPVTRLAGLGVFDGFHELRDASNFLLTALASTAAVALLQVSRGPQAASSPASQSLAGALAPLPLVLVAFLYFVRLQWVIHRRFAASRRKLPFGHRTATGLFTGGLVAVALVTDLLRVRQRFEFASLLPAYLRELWAPFVDVAARCDCPFSEERLAFLGFLFSLGVGIAKAAFVTFLAFEGAVLAAPIQVEANLVSVALFKHDLLTPGTGDAVKRLQFPLVHVERFVTPLLLFLPFLWMPNVYAAFLSETGFSAVRFGGIRLVLTFLACLGLLRRAKLATQVSTLLALPHADPKDDEERKEKKYDRRSAVPASSSASSPSAPPSRSLLLRLLDLLGLPSRLLLLVALCGFLLVLQAREGRDGPLLLPPASSDEGGAPLEASREFASFASPPSVSATWTCASSGGTGVGGSGATLGQSCGEPQRPQAKQDKQLGGDASSPVASPAEEQSGEETSLAEGGGTKEPHAKAADAKPSRTCTLVWSVLGNAEQKQRSFQILGEISLREKIFWARDAARGLLPFNSSSFVPFIQQLTSVVLVGFLATTAFLFTFASTEVRQRGLRRLSIWDSPAP
ncbi:hypothetical protein BESB_055490 [Besnoitia besnoiti]|uniref:Transmembrane protein n=1 Tax=Besnoitia besnoiti TaxID=94643 RepID=A0A2A9MBP2_BESBE|nr:hypothetical protein BESB_055490 [Besnoitia besnoiti]PFH35898.1 hypothetical protein BESB_055490 [Besnoitia besnoiti]